MKRSCVRGSDAPQNRNRAHFRHMCSVNGGMFGRNAKGNDHQDCVPSYHRYASTERVLQSESGSGSDSLLPFTVPSGDKGWKLNWTYNCSNVGKRSQFQVYIIQEAQTSERSTQLNIKDFPVSVFGDSGSSTSHFQGTGTFNLDVNSECRWTVAVVGVA